MIHSAQFSYNNIRCCVKLHCIHATKDATSKSEHVQEEHVSHEMVRFLYVEQEGRREEQREENWREGFGDGDEDQLV